MKVLAMFFGTAAVALAMTACNQTPAPAVPDTHDADVKAISDNEAQWNSDWAAKDEGKIATHYADDAVLIVSGMDPVKGKEAIRASNRQMLDDKAMSLTFHASRVEVSKSGELGYTEGTYKLTVTDPTTHKPVDDHGSYVTTYRKQADGSWKAVIDIAASAIPSAPPPAKHK